MFVTLTFLRTKSQPGLRDNTGPADHFDYTIFHPPQLCIGRSRPLQTKCKCLIRVLWLCVFGIYQPLIPTACFRFSSNISEDSCVSEDVLPLFNTTVQGITLNYTRYLHHSLFGGHVSRKPFDLSE